MAVLLLGNFPACPSATPHLVRGASGGRTWPLAGRAAAAPEQAPPATPAAPAPRVGSGTGARQLPQGRKGFRLGPPAAPPAVARCTGGAPPWAAVAVTALRVSRGARARSARIAPSS